jgi:hypothetical protein
MDKEKRERRISARIRTSLFNWYRERNINISEFINYNLARVARLDICPTCSRPFKEKRS